jgi:hypothetical protein|tara:strand:- start:2761 stop:5220 length:2460 start_codon:yes stop_codon:yes gene_type:complete
VLKGLIFVISACFISSFSFGQRTYTILPAEDEIKVDGILDEISWKKAQKADQFVMNYPEFGKKPSFQSEFYLTYTDEALYVAGKIYDNPDSVSYMLSQRDNFGNADWVGVYIDCYGNNLNASAFYTTSSGVELDALLQPLEEDFSWNAVWKSRVQKNDDGWTVEMRIPYAALRFPNKDIQSWNINFVRQVRRKREMSYWNPVNPAVFAQITQSGKLRGLKNIKPPVRLSFSPYAISYVEDLYDASEDKQIWQNRTTAGMDLKLGLNDAFTLDMALIPDFGQTISDNEILNLGPFEVQFNENRSFFKEGTDLFGIGGVFYSRRVGGTPYNNSLAQNDLDKSKGERVVQSATRAPLYNATKISGRTKTGLGIGLFNAIEGRTFSTILDSLGNERSVNTNPLTNYNTFVLSQNLVNNGKVSFLNTNVFREGSAREANVSVFSSSLFSKDREYSVTGDFRISNIIENYTNSAGYSYDIEVGKVQGKYQAYFNQGVKSDTYNPNDLGYLQNNNSQYYGVKGKWNEYKPKGLFLRKWGGADIYYEELYKPQLFSVLNINGFLNGTFRNFLTCGIDASVSPLGSVSHFESRQFGIPLNFGSSASLGGFYSSDYSKPFALDIRFKRKQFLKETMSYNSLTISPRFQFSPKFFVVLTSQYEHYENDFGYVRLISDSLVNGILIGTRNRDIVTNSISAELIFTKRMGVNIRLRHYWQRLKYSYFNDLLTNGDRQRNDYFPLNEAGNSVHNQSYNAFTLDVNYKWVFFPGCEFLIFYKNNIFAGKQGLDKNYFNTFQTLFNEPQLNSISAKLLVFVDVLYFKKGGVSSML